MARDEARHGKVIQTGSGNRFLFYCGTMWASSPTVQISSQLPARGRAKVRLLRCPKKYSHIRMLHFFDLLWYPKSAAARFLAADFDHGHSFGFFSLPQAAVASFPAACDSLRSHAPLPPSDRPSSLARPLGVSLAAQLPLSSGLALRFCSALCLRKTKCLPSCFSRCIRHRRRSLAAHRRRSHRSPLRHRSYISVGADPRVGPQAPAYTSSVSLRLTSP